MSKTVIPYRVEPCACGGIIETWSYEWSEIKRAVSCHQRTSQHLVWREMQHYADDPEAFGRIPRRDSTANRNPVNVSGPDGASGHDEEYVA